MTFTVAIPVYNGEKFLRQSLLSAINQTRPADEIIAVDDASRDQSARILQAPEWAGRVRYIFNEASSGFVDAWNRVIKYAHSEYVTILHQDDLLDPEYLHVVEHALNSNPNCEHLYCGYYYIDKHGARIGGSPKPHTLDARVFSGKEYAHRYLEGVVHNRHIHRCPGVVSMRKLLLDKCLYRKEAGLIADDDFFLRIGEFTDVVGISKPLASFRVHAESATGRLESLSYRLAADYIFQTRYYRSCPTLLDEADIFRIENQAVRFIDTYLIESMVKNDQAGRDASRRLRHDFEELVPTSFNRQSSLVARILWNIVKDRNPGLRAGAVYSKVLRALLALKKTLKHLFSIGRNREMPHL